MIELVRVTKRFGSITAVEEFHLEVPAGARVAVLGPSGCGKTTLLRLVAGLENPDAGEIRIAGGRVAGNGAATPPHARGVGFVFQDGALFPHMTVAGNVGYGVRGARAERDERVAEMLEAAGLAGLGARYPAQLSGGQQRRVALARALAPAPARLLMDEPLTNLDASARGELLALADSLIASSHASLLYVTHDAAEAGALGCRIVRMEAGRRAG
jgi:iron(III) transport system ATP-binding protein